MDESFPTRRRGLLSMRMFSYRSMAKFLLTIPLVLLFCYHPFAFMVDEQPTGQVTGTDHSDIIPLEVGSSIKGEIYRFIQRFYTGLTDEQEIALAKLIYDESQRYDCDPKLVLALIMVESSFYVKATSPKGARGLMQLRPYVAKALAQTDEEVSAGIRINSRGKPEFDLPKQKLIVEVASFLAGIMADNITNYTDIGIHALKDIA